ncbi:TonB-dependent receptor [bacterium]|nr:TonB-dependent receptor [bacterium]
MFFYGIKSTGLCCLGCMLGVLISGSLAKAQEIYIMDKLVIKAEPAGEGMETERINRKLLRAHKVVDLAEILSDEYIEATMIRKGAYGNEVAIRGFSQSNLGFFVDDTLLEGACGSRKDPSLSHLSLLNIERLEITQGPFDVTRAGALGGNINIVTRRPRKGMNTDIFGKYGSFGFISGGLLVNGGNSLVRGLLGYSYSESGQYQDGAGNQLSDYNPGYSEEARDMKAFQKHDVWGKVLFNLTENQSLLLDYKYGNAKDIMTPRVGMDIESEKINMSSIEYTLENFGSFSKKIKIKAYYNQVEHDPSNKYRNVSVYMANDVMTSFVGAKIENQQDSGWALLTYGVDFYVRKWNGLQINKDTGIITKPYLFPDVETQDIGLYIKADKEMDKVLMSFGLRGDWFQNEAKKLEDSVLIFSQNLTDTNKDSEIFPSGYIFGKYFLTDELNLFGGVGHSVRTPTGAERYLQASGGFYGNPDLKPTRNTEADIGIQMERNGFSLRAKGFYSLLKDYIYQQSGPPKTWTNINARMYGADLKIVIDLVYNTSLEAAVACQRGTKETQPLNNEDQDLAQIPPLKTRLALSYDNSGFFGIVDWIHSEKAGNVDADAGEQEVLGWNVFNLRAGYEYHPFVVNVGIENILDKAYAVANSYEWDVVGGSGANPKIVNEPGRFVFVNISCMF